MQKHTSHRTCTAHDQGLSDPALPSDAGGVRRGHWGACQGPAWQVRQHGRGPAVSEHEHLRACDAGRRARQRLLLAGRCLTMCWCACTRAGLPRRQGVGHSAAHAPAGGCERPPQAALRHAGWPVQREHARARPQLRRQAPRCRAMRACVAGRAWARRSCRWCRSRSPAAARPWRRWPRPCAGSSSRCGCRCCRPSTRRACRCRRAGPLPQQEPGPPAQAAGLAAGLRRPPQQPTPVFALLLPGMSRRMAMGS